MALTPEHQTFRDLVESFCLAIEQPRETPTETLHSIHRTLLALYSAALNVPELSGATYDDLPISIPNDDHYKIAKVVGSCTELDCYWFCYYPFATPPEEPVCSSLSSDLAEIWHDLKPGVLSLAHDESGWAADVFWDWRESFNTHWGDHAVDSIWAIHKLLRDSPVQSTQ